MYNIRTVTSSDIENFILELKALEDYELPKLNPEYCLGKHSKIAILNKNGTVIYSNYKSWYGDYINNELSHFIGFNSLIKSSNINLCNYNNSIFKLDFINNYGENRILIFSINSDEEKHCFILKNYLNSIIKYILIYVTLLLIVNYIYCREFKKTFDYLEQIIDYPEKRNNILNNNHNLNTIHFIDKLLNLLSNYDYTEWKNTRMYIDKQRLISDISHDSKNNLTVINGYISLLLDGINPPNTDNFYLKIIKDKIEDTAELISNFYEYSNIEHPDFPIKLEILNICEFLKLYFARKYNEILINYFILDVDIPDKAIYCKIDEVLFCRAIDNIIDNSIKYNNKNTKIKFNLTQNDNIVIISIGDNGSGIPDDIVDIIFDPFIFGKNSVKKSSSGLGMTITQKIISSHNATIRLKKVPDDGYITQFEIIIPIINNLNDSLSL